MAVPNKATASDFLNLMDAIPVVAVIKAKPGKERMLETVLKGLVAPTHREKGCLCYALHRSTQDPGTFVFIEKWASEVDLKDHLASAHVNAAFARQDELIEGMQIVSLDPMPTGDPLRGAI